MFTSLQIPRVNGSHAEPGSRAAYNWFIAAAGSAAPRSRLAMRAISNPGSLTEADYTGIDADQVREVKAFIGLRS
jgi:hypothetical protein